ncbi:MAG: hypothetical protein R3C56_28430 [Pirellulaceae bacterium]
MRLLERVRKTFRSNSSVFPHDMARLQTIIDRPHGMFIVTGPTGS